MPNSDATANVMPDLTFLLDMPATESFERISREPDRMEARGAEFMERVRQGFLAEASRSEQIVVIDAAQDVQAVHRSICQATENAISASRQAP